MNEETEQVETVEEPTTEPTEGIESEGYLRIETPAGDAIGTVPINSTTGEPIEGVTKADIDSLLEVMNKIESKTVTTNADGSPLAMTYDQGQQLIELISESLQWGITVIAVCLVIFVTRWVYKLFARDFFGGL